eukprot:COSAG03_NODE_145_length_11619_cov_4.863281_1_plen_81_part_10
MNAGHSTAVIKSLLFNLCTVTLFDDYGVTTCRVISTYVINDNTWLYCDALEPFSTQNCSRVFSTVAGTPLVSVFMNTIMLL